MGPLRSHRSRSEWHSGVQRSQCGLPNTHGAVGNQGYHCQWAGRRCAGVCAEAVCRRMRGVLVGKEKGTDYRSGEGNAFFKCHLALPPFKLRGRTERQ